jgi:hypothetical protein
MAANRTFQFMGNGYGDTPVTVTATINSTTIFSGTVPTLDQAPGPYDPAGQVVLFSIDDSAALNTDFAGSLPMTVVASGGYSVNFGEINSNYFQGNVANNIGAGTVDHFGQCYTGTPVNSQGTSDPRSSVVIDGIPQTQYRPPDGAWNYGLSSGSTMTYNFNIGLGQVSNVAGNVSNYTGPHTPTP